MTSSEWLERGGLGGRDTGSEGEIEKKVRGVPAGEKQKIPSEEKAKEK